MKYIIRSHDKEFLKAFDFQPIQCFLRWACLKPPYYMVQWYDVPSYPVQVLYPCMLIGKYNAVTKGYELYLKIIRLLLASLHKFTGGKTENGIQLHRNTWQILELLICFKGLSAKVFELRLLDWTTNKRLGRISITGYDDDLTIL